jgi:hypothetical protein
MGTSSVWTLKGLPGTLVSLNGEVIVSLDGLSLAEFRARAWVAAAPKESRSKSSISVAV